MVKLENGLIQQITNEIGFRYGCIDFQSDYEQNHKKNKREKWTQNENELNLMKILRRRRPTEKCKRPTKTS